MQEADMLYLLDTRGVYDPETLAAMAAAFDRICPFVPKSNSDGEVRQQLASKIIRLVDQGQRDPARLFELTLPELTGQNT
jgi:hypothetical protein